MGHTLESGWAQINREKVESGLRLVHQEMALFGHNLSSMAQVRKTHASAAQYVGTLNGSLALENPFPTPQAEEVEL